MQFFLYIYFLSREALWKRVRKSVIWIKLISIKSCNTMFKHFLNLLYAYITHTPSGTFAVPASVEETKMTPSFVF